jgi:hypothetical protein
VRHTSLVLVSFVCVVALGAAYQVFPLLNWPPWSTPLTLGLTTISAAALLSVAVTDSWTKNVPEVGLRVIQLNWIWSAVCLARGADAARDYWDWKAVLLGYLPSVLVSMFVVAGVSYHLGTRIIRFVLLWLFPLGFLAIPFTLTYTDEFYARLVMPVSVLLLTVPYLPRARAILVLAVAATSMLVDVTYRANVVRLLIPFGLLAAFRILPLLRTRWTGPLLAVLFAFPLVFLSLGVSGVFNVFAGHHLDALDRDVDIVLEGQAGTSNIASDTRTFLYREVLQSMSHRGSSFLVGEGGGAGYDTEWFGEASLNESGRFGSEVGFLNALLQSGVVGVILYALGLFVPAYFGVFRSHNRLSVMLGLFLAARWVVFFVEDVSLFDTNSCFLWLSAGWCLSSRFRSLTDSEVSEYFRAALRRGSSLGGRVATADGGRS